VITNAEGTGWMMMAKRGEISYR